MIAFPRVIHGFNKQQSAINGDARKEGGGGETTMIVGGEVVRLLLRGGERGETSSVVSCHSLSSRVGDNEGERGGLGNNNDNYERGAHFSVVVKRRGQRLGGKGGCDVVPWVLGW